MLEPREASHAGLGVADDCLEQVTDVSTSEEGADLAAVASAHALVVLARHTDRQNGLLASLARTVEAMERHLEVIARATAGMSTPIPPSAKQTLSPTQIEVQPHGRR